MAATITERQIGTERAIDLGFAVLVASKSEPGAWHQVGTATCDCKGFQHRRTCRHLAVAEQAQMAGIEDAQPVRPEDLVPTGPACFALMSLED